MESRSMQSCGRSLHKIVGFVFRNTGARFHSSCEDSVYSGLTNYNRYQPVLHTSDDIPVDNSAYTLGTAPTH